MPNAKKDKCQITSNSYTQQTYILNKLIYSTNSYTKPHNHEMDRKNTTGRCGDHGAGAGINLGNDGALELADAGNLRTGNDYFLAGDGLAGARKNSLQRFSQGRTLWLRLASPQRLLAETLGNKNGEHDAGGTRKVYEGHA